MNDARPDSFADPQPPRQYLHPEKRRYYAVWVQQDLFGTWCVMRAWGGSGTRLGRLVALAMPDLASCAERVAMEDRRRREKGYLPVQ